MKGRHLGILCCIAVMVFCAGGAMVVAGTVKIMPLGDSITKGSVSTPEEAKYPTYRYWLWNDLVENGYDVDFVGSWSAPDFKNFTFDQDNEGHGGYSTDEILHGIPNDKWQQGHLSQWIQGYEYDVVLLLIGTNDVVREVPLNETVTNIKKMVKVVRQRNPHVAVFIATLPPTKVYRQGLIDLNQEIPGIVEELDTKESRVILVEQYYGYNGTEDNQPPLFVHPCTSGEKKLAKNWYDALSPYLDGTLPTPIPTPTPTPSPTPVPTPEPTALPIPVVTPAVMQPTLIVPTTPTSAPLDPGASFGARRYVIGGQRGMDGFARYEWGSSARGDSVVAPSTTPGTGSGSQSRAFARWYRSDRWTSVPN